MNRHFAKGLKVPFTSPQTFADVAKVSSPGLAYTAWTWLLNLPVEKWASFATFVLVVLQIIFLLRDRLKKRRAARRAGK